MADVDDNNFIRYVYRGEEGERIPREATHIFVGKDVTCVRAHAAFYHRNIVEVICHHNVEKIEEWAFRCCLSLKRVIMPGVKIVEEGAIQICPALTDVECGKLEIIKDRAFSECKSLRNINLPSARIVEGSAFYQCYALTDVKFGNKLERFDSFAFSACRSLQRITIPLKDGLITADSIFIGCRNLRHVDLIEGAELHESIATLQFESWRNDMHEEIDSINQILPNAWAGKWNTRLHYTTGDEYTIGEKARVIRRWIRSVFRKIVRYQAATLQLVLPRDIVMNSVLPFLELPAHTFFEVEDKSDEEEDGSEEAEEDGEVSEGDEDDDQNSHVFCCLRKLWPCPRG